MRRDTRSRLHSVLPCLFYPYLAVKPRARESSDRHPHLLLHMDASFQSAHARPRLPSCAALRVVVRINRFGLEGGRHPSRGPPISWFSIHWLRELMSAPGTAEHIVYADPDLSDRGAVALFNLISTESRA